MKLKDAVKDVGHSCRQREYLRIADELGLSEPWTQADVDAIRAARTFNPGVAARKVYGKMKADEYLRAAVAAGVGEPPHTMEQIHLVRDSLTPEFPGMTSDQIAAKMDVDVEWVRRMARQFEIGVKVATGSYMVDGKRVRRPSKSRSFTDSDIVLLMDVMSPVAHTHPLRVSKTVYAAAARVAERATDPRTGPDDVMIEWVEDGAKASLSG